MLDREVTPSDGVQRIVEKKKISDQDLIDINKNVIGRRIQLSDILITILMPTFGAIMTFFFTTDGITLSRISVMGLIFICILGWTALLTLYAITIRPYFYS